MPNHITNILEIRGTPEQVEEFFNTFNTHHKAEVNKAHDGRVICQMKGSNEEDVNSYNSYGWLDLKTGLFENRKEGISLGLPEGYEIEISQAWDQFPDFNKIIPCPKELDDLNPHHGIITAVKKKFQTPVSGNALVASLEFMSREKQSLEFEGEDKATFERACEAYKKTGFVYWYDWNIANWGTKWNSYSHEKIAWNIFKFETAWSAVPVLIAYMSKKFPLLEIIYKYADEDFGYNTGIYVFKDGIVSEHIPQGGSKEAYELAFSVKPDMKENYVFDGNNYVYKDEE